VAKQPKGELVVVTQGFDYALVGDAADRVRSSAEKIRSTVQKTIEDIIVVGQELLTVKEAVGHGHFGAWLRAEFGWTERTAQNFMSVAERFGANPKLISDLTIQPTAAYLLAAPSAPDEARQQAIERAEAGEEITTSVAKEILAETRKKKRPRRQKAVPTVKLGLRLMSVLERYKERWKPDELSELARQLREFADALEKPERGGKKKTRS
jgi:gas vesicle protein